MSLSGFSWLQIALILLLSTQRCFAESGLKPPAQELEEIRGHIGNHRNNAALMDECLRRLTQLKGQTKDRLLLFRAEYWQYKAWFQKLDITAQATLIPEIRDHFIKMQKEYPEFKNDSRMVEINFFLNQQRCTGELKSEADFALWYLKEGVRATTFNQDSEATREKLNSWSITALENYEYRKLCDAEIRKVQELAAEGKSGAELSVARTSQKEKEYLSTRTVSRVLEEIKAEDEVRKRMKLHLDTAKKDLSPASLDQMDARLSATYPQPGLHTPEVKPAEPQAPATVRVEAAPPVSKKNNGIWWFLGCVAVLAILFIIFAQSKSR